jgi:hypothetical protein
MYKGILTGLRRFMRADDGLVTVEWVAIAAAVVAGAVTVAWLVMTDLKTPAGTIGTGITSVANTAPSGTP